MVIYKTYKFRLYPTAKQRDLIHKSIGASRFVFNYFLDKKIKLYEDQKAKISAYECCKLVKRELNIEHPWLKEVDSIAIRSAIFNLHDAFNMFFKGNGYPKFKSKKYPVHSYRTSYINDNIRIDLNKKVIRLPKLKDVSIRGYRNLNKLDGRIINCTVTRELTGKYYVSVLCEQIINIKEQVPANIVGIDLGIKDLVVTSNGEVYKNPQVINKFEKRIKRIQKELSRKIKNSKNYFKTKKKLAIVYKKLKNARKYTLHHLTNKLIKENDIIVMENLNVKSMVKNRNVSKLITDASFHEIKRYLKYKATWVGKHVIEVNTYYPSSQICSICNTRNNEMKDLSKRKFECNSCGNVMNRDLNASINIMFEGVKLYYQTNK